MNWFRIFFIVILFVVCIFIGYKIYNTSIDKFSINSSNGIKLSKENESQLIEQLRPYDGIDINGNVLEYLRLGKDGDGGYVFPKILLKQSQVLLSYGILDDISFEEDFIKHTGLPVYAFDCTTSLTSRNKLKIFKECITDNPETCELKPSSTFKEHINRLQLQNKTFLLKMDIEGSEYIVFKDIQPYFDNISGIIIEVHMPSDDTHSDSKMINLLKLINSKFYLCHIHMNDCGGDIHINNNIFSGNITTAMELTFINKNLLPIPTFKKFKGPTPLDQSNSGRVVSFEFK